jgi:hypothetical protein
MPAIAMPPESVAELEEVAQNEDAEPLSHSETIGEPEVEENDDLELSDVAKAQLALQKKSTIVTAADAETEAEKRRGVLNLWTGREGRVHRGATLSTLIAARESPLSPMPVNTTESQFRAAAFPQRCVSQHLSTRSLLFLILCFFFIHQVVHILPARWCHRVQYG